MPFHADLHVHSKHSRATSRDLDLENLAWWARRKGIGVVGTGDFTHPAWMAELKEKLVPAAPGLFRLRDEIERGVTAKLPATCRTPAHFMLSVEISTIYKKGPLTRKIHHLLYAPDIETAERINARLARIGNITADGRPILGLDSRDLLEITLEASPDAYLVPAHIWTPWFAVLGSQAGFDSIVECYRDLSAHIFALETGLSSDPAMNWRLSELDRYRLVSNSDAHSPAKLGRETTLFDCDLDYFALRKALETGRGYVGTVEFFPEEGKYHLDGHRKCGVRLTPEETAAHGGRCPVCGQPVTVGVLNRIEALADRSEAQAAPPPTAGKATNLVPLPEVLSEIEASGPSSKAVARHYDRLLDSLGPELWILRSAPIEDIARAGSSLLAEAITRLRARKVLREAGYDGEYGVIRLFEESELQKLTRGDVLFDMAVPRRQAAVADSLAKAPGSQTNAIESMTRLPLPQEPMGLDADQRAATETVEGPLLIVAGPGSGKTRTLTHRIAHLVAKHGIPAQHCLAITFTRRAAAELQERLGELIPAGAERVAVHTFHSLGLAILQAHPQAAGLHRGFQVADEAERGAALAEALQISARQAASLLRAISKAKRTQRLADDEIAQAMSAYQQMLALKNWIDFDDLVGLAVYALSADPGLAAHYRDLFRWISVDELQDVDEQQYRLLALLAPPRANLCVIGDPNQAIYGFRGADAACFERFKQDYPAAAIITLRRNYRSSGTIVTAAAQVMAMSDEDSIAEVVRGMHERIAIHVAPTERAEAEFVIQTIEGLIGGHSFFSIDSGRSTGSAAAHLSFADFAVLYRTNAQAGVLREAFERSGMPFKQHGHDAHLERPDTQIPPVELAEDSAPATVAPVASIDTWDPKTDRVSLLTLHAAKGLEFPVVFIVGLEDGLLPLYWRTPDAATLEEERRLFYVGMTRAKDRLILSRALKRRWRGRLQTLNASPFLHDIEAELLKRQHVELPPKKPADPQLKLL